MQITKSQIESELHRLSELIGAQPNQLPTIDNSKEAWPNISFSANRTVYYNAHERGEELFSFPAFDLEHLMFMAFKDITFSMAVEHERKNRKPKEDFRRQLFLKQVELMRTLNSDWAERTKKEIEATLRTPPFNDELTA
jgi:hypothetical protein